MFRFVFIFLACLPFLSFAQEPKDFEIIDYYKNLTLIEAFLPTNW